MYLKVYMCLHLVALSTVFILSKLVHGERKPNSSTMRTSQKTNNSSANKNADKLDNHHCDNNRIAETVTNQTSSTFTSSTRTSETNENDRKNNYAATNGGMNGHYFDSNNRVNDNQFTYNNLIKSRNMDFLGKTVTGFVEFRDDLMRMDEVHAFSMGVDGVRKRGGTHSYQHHNNINGSDAHMPSTVDNNVDAFIKKEIDALNAAVQQTNMLPAVVLSNGHAK